jgi:RNA polymerase sigma factor (sigma-70 family)
MAHGQLHRVLRQVRRMMGAADAQALTDRQLLERFAGERDQAAFAALVERHGALVLGVCRRVLGHEQEAEDAFQATFVVLARKARSAGWQESIANWLYEVARRVARKARSEALRRQERERQAADMQRPNFTVDAVHELQQVLDEELARLPAKYRAPLLLCYLEGKTRDEAAEQLGWSLGAVKGRLERGRALLHERLVRRGLALSVTVLPALLAQGAAPSAVAAALCQSAVQSAMLAATGRAAAASSVAALCDAVVKEMFLAKLKLVASVLLALAAAGAGVGLAAVYLPGLVRLPAETQPAEHSLPSLASLRPRATLHLLHHGPVHAVAFSPDSRTLVSADHGIRQWDLATGQERPRRLQHPGVTALAYSPDGAMLASAGEGGAIALWDSSGHETQALTRHHQAVLALAYSPDGRWLASGGREPWICLWQPALKNPEPRRLHARPVAALAFSPDGKTLASAGGHWVRLWDVASGVQRAAFGHDTARYLSLVFLADGKRLAAGSERGSIHLFDPVSGTALGEWAGHEGGVTSMAVSPDGTLLASGGLDHTVRLWEAATGKELHRLSAHEQGVLAVAFSPAGKSLAAGGRDRRIQVWELAREE